MSTIRGQLRAKVKARLQQIRAGGQVVSALSGNAHVFVTDIGRDVVDWRVGDVLPAEMPCAGFADTDAEGTVAGADIGQQAHGLNVQIVGFVAGDDHVGQATSALFDILAVIGSDPEWDNLADAYTTLTGTELEIHPDGRTVAAAIVNIRIDYYTPLWEI
jgi:hypothetical protein